MDTCVFSITPSIFFPWLSPSPIPVCPCQSLWSVCEPTYISWYIGCKYVLSRKAKLWITFPVLPSAIHSHALCCTVGLLSVFSNVSTNLHHIPRLWDAPSLSLISWRTVNYLIVDLECPRKRRKQWDKWCIVVVVACFSSCFCKREIHLARSSSMHLKQKVMPIWLLQYFVAMLMLSSVFLVLLPISGGRKLHCRVIEM